jgi:hypothetical protein
VSLDELVTVVGDDVDQRVADADDVVPGRCHRLAPRATNVRSDWHDEGG